MFRRGLFFMLAMRGDAARGLPYSAASVCFAGPHRPTVAQVMYDCIGASVQAACRPPVFRLASLQSATHADSTHFIRASRWPPRLPPPLHHLEATVVATVATTVPATSVTVHVTVPLHRVT